MWKSYVKSKLANLESQKSAILPHWEALNFDFSNFCTFWRLKFIKLTHFRAPKMAKMSVLVLLQSSKSISRKIWKIEKSWNFHSVDLTFCAFFSYPIFRYLMSWNMKPHFSVNSTHTPYRMQGCVFWAYLSLGFLYHTVKYNTFYVDPCKKIV